MTKCERCDGLGYIRNPEYIQEKDTCPCCDGKGYTQTEKKEARCKMSIYIEEYDEEANYCGMHTLVKCEGTRDDSKNCPYWRGAVEP